ncbi:MAG: GNAT family N-acetyltransferase [Acidimicrobiia bacterium]
MTPDGELAFRTLARSHYGLLGGWLREPHVARWWIGPSTPAALEAKYGPRIDGHDPAEVFIAEVGGRPFGLIQRYRISDWPEWSAAVDADDGAGIDYLIGEPERVGRGLGSRMIRAFVPTVFERYPELTRVVAAPQQANVASWRALEKAGFARIWSGMLESDDPSDAGPAFVYARERLRRATAAQVPYAAASRGPAARRRRRQERES